MQGLPQEIRQATIDLCDHGEIKTIINTKPILKTSEKDEMIDSGEGSRQVKKNEHIVNNCLD